MLSVFYGTDWKQVNEAATKRLAAFAMEHPGAETFALSADNFSEGSVEQYGSSSGLFTSAQAVVISHMLGNEDYGETLTDQLESLAASDNLFIFKEGELSAKLAKLVAKHAQESQEFVGRQTVQKPAFQIFDLANALGMRDKKNLWLGYQRALRQGIAPEEISNILMWQVKTLLLVSSGATEGIKPFVLGKAKGFLKNYSRKELEDLSLAFISLYHDARRGEVEFEIGLEKLILTI